MKRLLDLLASGMGTGGARRTMNVRTLKLL